MPTFCGITTLPRSRQWVDNGSKKTEGRDQCALGLPVGHIKAVRELETRQLFGRKQIYTDVETITAENVVDVLRQALNDHTVNQGEIQYLWDYYRGKTPILQKTKKVRESINHKICVNRANEIVTFKRGYGFGEPIQYISRGTNDDVSDEIAELNEQMFLAGKQAEDSALAEWMYVCGLGMRMALSGKDVDEPGRVYTLDSRNSFNRMWKCASGKR